MRPADFLLRQRAAPGDCVALSALVRDLHAAGYGVAVEAAFADQIFAHDPRVRPVGPATRAVPISLAPTALRAKTDRTARYVYAAHESFAAAGGIAVRLGPPRPDVVLSPAELIRSDDTPYALVLAGTKSDCPAKGWGHANFAAVVAATPELNWVQAGRVEVGRFAHYQQAIPGARNLLGQTTIRQLMRLVAHADVVLCLASLPMLLAAGLGVPCVAVAGGREHSWFFDGLGVDLLHTVGRLPCCARGGCGAMTVAPPHPGPFPPGFLCADPTTVGGEPVGRCMALVTPEEVAAAVRAAKARGRARHHIQMVR